jgi:outer membrane biosynthesis protein TonB
MAKLDIDTLLTPRLSVQFIVVWALAAAGAIVVGVLPALWINGHRADAATAAATDEPVLHMSVVPIEAPAPAPAAEPTVPEPTVPAAAAPTETAMPEMTVSRPQQKRAKVERTKQTPSHTTKRETCDVYLHPHGCPR